MQPIPVAPKRLHRGGTPGFAAPEVVNDLEHDGTKADVFSLGVVAYLMATFEYPYEDAQIEAMSGTMAPVADHGMFPSRDGMSPNDYDTDKGWH